MRDHDDLPYIVIERHSAGGMGTFLWGALLGAGAALLLAPRSGQQTQEEIRQGVRRIREAAEDRVNDVRDTVTGSVARTRGRIQDQLDSVRDSVESRAERARQAIDAGRRAAREARSELERRVSDAREAVAGDFDAADDLGPPDVDVLITEVIVDDSDQRRDFI